MTRPWRITAKVLAWGLIAIAALYLAALAINSFDEQLAPDTTALLTPPPNPYRPEENIYVALAGLDAPSGQPVIATGQARINEHNEHVDALFADPAAASKYLAKSDPRRLTFKGSLNFCHPELTSYWHEIQSHRVALEALFEQNRELSLRYLGLHRQRGYYETARMSDLAPVNFANSQLRCLFLADFALRMQSGDGAEEQSALADFQDDARLWGLVLQGEGTLLSKAFAMAYLRTDYLLLADLIADPRVDIASGAPDAGSAQLFPLIDWRIGNAFATQFRRVTEIMAVSAAPSKRAAGGMPLHWWDRLGGALSASFFRLNATENLLARQTRQLIEMADADPPQFFRARERYEQWLRDNVTRSSPRMLYNPIGKTLVALAAGAGEDQPVQVYDTAALQRLVRLSYEVRRQAITAAAIPSFMQQHPQWATHPLDGSPFLWNEKTGEISVGTLARGARPFTIRIWQPPVSSGKLAP